MPDAIAQTARESCSCGLAMDNRVGHACNEEAFRYLLAVQRKRSERSGNPFLLLLVSLQERAGEPELFPRAAAQELFSAMCRAFRDTDVLGWYKDQQVAGAVLTELEDVSNPDASESIVRRVSQRLGETLPPFLSSRLQIHVCQIQPTLTA